MSLSMFTHDSDLAHYMLSSGVLKKACNAICNTPISLDDQDSPSSIFIQVFETSDCKIIAFRSSLCCTVKSLEEECEIVAPSNQNLFEFINPKVNSGISINKTALDVFAAHFEDLSRYQDQIIISKPLLVTGNSLAGSIASLFTLYLLDTVYRTPTTTRPVCITFGSPLLGDAGLQKAIYHQSSWPSCFVHVALSHDHIPKLFGSPNYDPFGLFLFCSKLGCACIDQPESVKQVMVALRCVGDLDLSGIQIEHYRRELVDQRNNKGISELGDLNAESLLLGITLDLQAIGILQKPEEINNDIRSLIDKIKKTKESGITRKRNELDKKRKLNEIKISMTYLEWYKKKTINDGGYYDAYKKPNAIEKRKSRDKIKAEKTKLEIYWKNMVAEAKQMPQEDTATFQTSFLFAGAAYRRMVEPLHIADHYLSGKTDYINTARLEHFKLLEKWFDDDKKPENQTNPPVQRKNVAASLTEDSCFWAHVEEAIISFDVLTNIQSCDVKKDAVVIKLKDFEDYAMLLIRDYSVSSEIFLPNSTFMEWWVEYKRYKDTTTGGASYSASLANFMTNRSQAYA